MAVPGQTEGWDWFKSAEKQVDEQREKDGHEREEVERSYAVLFSSPLGREVLEDLARFNTVPTFDPVHGFYDGAAYGFYRTGMQAFDAYIRRMVERGLKPRE